MDINTQLRLAVKTGEVAFGFKQALEAAKGGHAKLFIFSSNCPSRFKDEIQIVASSTKTPLYYYKGSSLDLGLACGKRFGISTLTIKKHGDSDILRLGEA